MSLSRRELLWPFGRARAEASAPPASVPPASAPVPPPARFARGPVPGARPLPASMVPRVSATACLAMRTFCSVCVERCPVPGALVMAGGQPRVDEAACTGCGQCVAVCPAPVMAFELVFRGAR